MLLTLVLGRLVVTNPGGSKDDQPSSRAAMSAGNPPVARGPHRVGVIRIRDLFWMRMASRYSSQSGCSPDAAEVLDQAVEGLRHVQHVGVAVTWTHGPFQSSERTSTVTFGFRSVFRVFARVG